MSQPTQGRSSTSGIKWFLAISGVLFAAVALGYSIYQGQFVSSITPTEIIFGQKTVPEAEVRDAQSDVRANLDQLEEQVAEAPSTSRSRSLAASGKEATGTRTRSPRPARRP